MTIDRVAPALGPATAGGRDGLLRRSLQLDAAVSGAAGALLLAGGPALADALGLPSGLPRPLGLALVAYAAALGAVVSRPAVSRPAARAVVALNALWVAGSLVLAVAGPFALTRAGVAFVTVQAAAVALFADLQALGLRRARPASR